MLTHRRSIFVSAKKLVEEVNQLVEEVILLGDFLRFSTLPKLSLRRNTQPAILAEN